MTKKTCPVCSTDFAQSGNAQVYCTRTCRNKARVLNYSPKVPTKNCATCGNSFVRLVELRTTQDFCFV